MKRPTAVIAEDEPPLRRELKDALTSLWADLEIIAEAADGLQAIQALETHRPDVVFLDIQMPGVTGLDVAPCSEPAMSRRVRDRVRSVRSRSLRAGCGRLRAEAVCHRAACSRRSRA